jgi:hypothetical protein
MNTNTRSPLKGEPLRFPGQSLDEKLDKELDNKIVPYILTIIVGLSITIQEWYRWFFETKPSPFLLSIIVLPAILYCIYGLYNTRTIVKRVKLGRDGERLVGQYLDNLRNETVSVFHDLIGDNYNIDHVVVSTKGVFVIETKTYSMPKRGEATITYDSDKVFVLGSASKKDVLKQAKFNQESLRKIISDKTGRVFPMRTVIVFPGWFIKDKRNHSNDAPWVLNPKGFPKFHEKSNNVISVDDYKLISKQLTRYIREVQKQKKDALIKRH